MPDVQGLQVPVKLRLELGAVVRLNDVHPERQPAQTSSTKPDRCPLIAGVVDLEHPHARAVVDRCELVKAFARARNPLEELHVHLQPMARLGLLVALPALAVRRCF